MRLGANLDLNSYKGVNAADPTSAQDVATKAYVDAVGNGLDPKPGVASVAVANVTLSGAQTIGGVSLSAGQLVLLTAQSSASQNGPWVVASGSWTRPTWFTGTQHPGAYSLVEAGDYAGHGFIMTGTSDVTVDTTSQTWQEFTGAADITVVTPVVKTGNQLSLTTVPVGTGGTGATTAAGAKTNLGFMSRYAADIGDGSSTTIAVTYSLGTLDVIWQVYKKSDGVDELISSVRTDANTLTLTFGTAPTTNGWRVVVIG